MSRRPSSIVLLLVVLAAAAGAVWVITTRTRPALAVYDSMPLPPPPPPGAVVADMPVADSSVADSSPSVRLAAPARDSAARHPPNIPASRARVRADSDSASRPHRSDNYGGYSGYGSKERRGDPNAR